MCLHVKRITLLKFEIRNQREKFKKVIKSTWAANVHTVRVRIAILRKYDAIPAWYTKRVDAASHES